MYTYILASSKVEHERFATVINSAMQKAKKLRDATFEIVFSSIAKCVPSWRVFFNYSLASHKQWHRNEGGYLETREFDKIKRWRVNRFGLYRDTFDSCKERNP